MYFARAMRLPIRGRGWCVILGVSACFGAAAPAATAGVPSGMPTDVPPAASQAPAALPEPSSTAWPFPNSFPQTSGTGRLAGGASRWSDFIYDDYGATSLPGAPVSSYDQS